jgi:hypothetical protein
MLCVAVGASAYTPLEKLLYVYNWPDLMWQRHIPNAEVISMDGDFVLKIENTNNAPLEITLLTMTNSALAKKLDLISLDVKYENVQEEFIPITNSLGMEMHYARGEFVPKRVVSAALTLLVHYPPDAQGGDENTNLQFYNIEGASNWKPQIFNISPNLGADGEILPTRVELKINLPTSGTVYLRPIKLIGIRQSWWSPQTAGLIGGIGGSLIGCLGGLIGILASMGKGRRFVLTTTVILIVTGILLVIAGVTAVAMKQPYAVWYPLLLGGTILTFVLSINMYSIKRRYDDLEIRRMTSMDATGR